MEKFYDLSFSNQPDGSIRLMQSDHGEDYIIDMHPEQILFIARRLCGMKPETAERVKDLERKLAVLDNRIAAIVLDDTLRDEIVRRIGDGFEIIQRLDSLYDLAVEFTVGLEPDYDLPNLAPTRAPTPSNSSQPTPEPQKPQPSATLQATG